MCKVHFKIDFDTNIMHCMDMTITINPFNNFENSICLHDVLFFDKQKTMLSLLSWKLCLCFCVDAVSTSQNKTQAGIQDRWIDRLLIHASRHYVPNVNQWLLDG
jgi:hypothetical protein